MFTVNYVVQDSTFKFKNFKLKSVDKKEELQLKCNQSNEIYLQHFPAVLFIMLRKVILTFDCES